MEMMRDGVLTFLAAVGLSTLVYLTGALLLRTGRTRIPGLLLVLPLRGEAPALEADVRELRRLRDSVPGAEILLADCGLTDEARQLAEYLAYREEGAVLQKAQDITIT